MVVLVVRRDDAGEGRKIRRGEQDNPVGRMPARCLWWRLQLETINVSAVLRLWLLILWGSGRPCEGTDTPEGSCSSNAFLPRKVIIDIVSYNERDLPFPARKAFMTLSTA